MKELLVIHSTHYAGGIFGKNGKVSNLPTNPLPGLPVETCLASKCKCAPLAIVVIPLALPLAPVLPNTVPAETFLFLYLVLI